MNFEQVIHQYPLGETIVGNYACEKASNYDLRDIRDYFTDPPIDCKLALENDNNTWYLYFFWYDTIDSYLVFSDHTELSAYDSEYEAYRAINPDTTNETILSKTCLQSPQTTIFKDLDPTNTYYTWEEISKVIDLAQFSLI